MNIQCFSIQEIPDYIRQKFKFKQQLWIDLGKNANSAIMCSIIHYYSEKDVQQLEQVVQQTKPNTQTTISFHNQLKLLIQQQDSIEEFFYNLKQIDSRNLSSGQYLDQYLSQKGIQNSTQDNLLMKVSIEFKIQIYVYGYQGNPKKHGKDERNQIVLYNSGSCWYYIIQEVSKQRSSMRQQNQEKECSYCHKWTSLSYSPACSHSICIDCLKKQFQSTSLQRFNCPFTKCPTMIERNRFLEFRDQLEKEQKQSHEQTKKQNVECQTICCKCKKKIEIHEVFQNPPCSHLCCKKCLSIYNDNYYLNRPEYIKCLQCQIPIDIGTIKIFFDISTVQLKQSKDQIQNNFEKCEKCSNLQAQQDLFQNPSCKHIFCRSCLAKYTSKYSCNLCLSKSCTKYLIDLQQRQPQSPQKLYNKNQDDDISNIVGCSKCYRHQKSIEYYNNYCGHSYCQSCADQEIVKGKPYFQCYSSICKEQIIVEDVQQYFYNQLQNKNKKSCNLCYESYLPSSMFKNYKCDHYLCYNCVNKIAQKQLYNVTCPVKMCTAYINAEELDKYFTEKQEEMLKEQLKEEEELKLKLKQEEEELKKQQQQPSSISSEIQNQTMLNEDEMVRIAIENSLENQNQQNQLKLQSKINNSAAMEDNKSSQVIKAKLAQQKLIEDPKQDDQVKENMEMEANNESEITQVLKQNIEGNCTFCRFPFSDFNLPQQLGCKKHRIGVCCLRYGVQCSQCIYSEIKKKDQSKQKKKFTIFQEDSYYPHSPQYVTRDAEDAKPNSRLSSRIYAQNLQQNNGLSQSQFLYNSTQAMRNASVGYTLSGICRRF